MKLKNLSRLLLFAFVIMCTVPSCVKEGPMGENGTNGENGINGENGSDGTVSCLACHSGSSMLEKQAQFVLSGHKVGKFTLGREVWSASCGKCHTPVGFVQFAEFGADAIYGNIENSETFDCSTCHGIHATFEGADIALRKTSTSPSASGGATLDVGGNSNICVLCHQARTAPPNIAKPGDATFRIASVHYGPHHGPQGNLLQGVGFSEIPGAVPYPAAKSGKHFIQAQCTGCHMSEFDKAKNEGGHSFAPSIKACNICHNATNTDFNYGGKRTQIAVLLEELKEKLLEKGVIKLYSGGFELDEETGEIVELPGIYEPVVGTFPMIQAQAYFNWIGLEEDRSFGAHNPQYATALLMNSIEALNQ